MYKEDLQLTVIGMNYKTSTISDRENFLFNRKEISDVLKYFIDRDDVEGVVIICTCNRLEFYFVLHKDVDPFSIVNDYYIKNRKISISNKTELFYTYYQSDVAKHLFTIISGLDSLVLGEYQIQGQIKDFYSLACSVKAAEKILHKLFHSSFRTGKMVRCLTKIGSGKQSVSGVSFKIIKDKLSINDFITIVGVNENTKIIAEELKNAGYKNLFFVNRTLYKAQKLADKYDGTAFTLTQIEEPLLKSNCIFTCTGAQGIIIRSELLNKVYTSTHQLKLAIDMAMPRDIENEDVVKGIKIYDLDSLKKYLEDQKREIGLDVPVAQKIISDEAKFFEVWTESLNDDVIQPIVNKAEHIRLQLLDEIGEKISENEYNLLDKFSHQLLHRMKSIFNETVRTGGKEKINTVVRLK